MAIDPTSNMHTQGEELRIYKSYVAYLIDMLGGSITLSKQEVLDIFGSEDTVEVEWSAGEEAMTIRSVPAPVRDPWVDGSVTLMSPDGTSVTTGLTGGSFSMTAPVESYEVKMTDTGGQVTYTGSAPAAAKSVPGQLLGYDPSNGLPIYLAPGPIQAELSKNVPVRYTREYTVTPEVLRYNPPRVGDQFMGRTILEFDPDRMIVTVDDTPGSGHFDPKPKARRSPISIKNFTPNVERVDPKNPGELNY